MTRQPHDQFAKEYLEELLKYLGTVEIDKNVKSEVREIDIWFSPASTTVENHELGLLAKMAFTKCLFEPFRNAPSKVEIRNCMLKLYSVHGELIRQAKREEGKILETELPFLWILTPTCSAEKLAAFAAEEDDNWCQGIYFLPEAQKTAIVVLNELPINEDTLWLRVLGKGKTQTQGVKELIKVSTENKKWNYLLEILASWRKNIEVKTNFTDEDRELIMSLSPAYLKQREEWREEGKLEGVQQGVQEGLRLIIVSLLTAHFGNLDEELSNIVNAIIELPLAERTDLLLNLSHLSRDELLAKLTVS